MEPWIEALWEPLEHTLRDLHSHTTQQDNTPSPSNLPLTQGTPHPCTCNGDMVSLGSETEGEITDRALMRSTLYTSREDQKDGNLLAGNEITELDSVNVEITNSATDGGSDTPKNTEIYSNGSTKISGTEITDISSTESTKNTEISKTDSTKNTEISSSSASEPPAAVSSDGLQTALRGGERSDKSPLSLPTVPQQFLIVKLEEVPVHVYTYRIATCTCILHLWRRLLQIANLECGLGPTTCTCMYIQNFWKATILQNS